MAGFRSVMKSGHKPAAFLYLDVWALDDAMGPTITEAFKLAPAR